MRLCMTLSPLALVSGVWTAAVAAAAGTLTFQDGDKFTFKYTTSSAKSKNWIGIYHTTGGPDDEKQHDPSLRWVYAPDASGTVQIDAPVRASGQYKAYFLADDAYKWITNPITFTPQSRDYNPANEVRVLTYNLWNGGTKVNGYHDKQVRFITNSGADIIGLQEATGNHAQRLAQALGWNFHQANSTDTAAIISRHPIVKRHAKIIERSAGVTINVGSDPSRAVNFWSIHTTAYPYGPYEACFEGKTGSQITDAETTSGRVKEVTSLLQGTTSQRAESNTFMLVGDFNSPSHLDWTTATTSKHCGVTFQWPITKLVSDAGLTDSFRAIYPDPAAVPGNTWSPIFPSNQDENKPEPQDRIDFIFHKTSWSLVDSAVKVAGSPKSDPNYTDNEWTSDHAALLTTYRIGTKTCRSSK